MNYCPVYHRDEDEFIILKEEFKVADAHMIMSVVIGSVIEQVYFGFKYAGRFIELDEDQLLPHVLGVISKTGHAGLPVGFISGPLFKEASIGEINEKL